MYITIPKINSNYFYFQKLTDVENQYVQATKSGLEIILV